MGERRVHGARKRRSRSIRCCCVGSQGANDAQGVRRKPRESDVCVSSRSDGVAEGNRLERTERSESRDSGDARPFTGADAAWGKDYLPQR